MKVVINGEPISLFEGAIVEHAIRKYSSDALAEVQDGTLVAIDRYGNSVSLHGRLMEGDELSLVENVDLEQADVDQK